MEWAPQARLSAPRGPLHRRLGFDHSPRALVSVVAGGHGRSGPVKVSNRRARGRAAGPAPIVFQLGLVPRPRPRDGPQRLADGFGPLAGAPWKGSSPMGRPTREPLALDHGSGRRSSATELAPGKTGRYGGGNCPGCGSAPIEACREADGVNDYPLTAVRLGRFFGLLSIAVVEAGRA